MADPIKWESTILLAKAEVTELTDPTPTGAANAILGMNVVLRPMEGQDVSRNHERPFGGAQEEIPVGVHCVLTFETELAGSGIVGTAPAWGVLMRGCRCAETVTASTSVEYTPITDNPESLAFYMWKGPTLHKLIGSRGTFEAVLNAQAIPVIKWTFFGIFVAPSATARVTPDFSDFAEPLVVTNANTPTFTIGGTDYVLRNFSFNKANKVEPRFLVNSERVIIVDTDESIALQIETPALGTYNPYTTAIARTKREIVLAHGTVAGNIATLTVDKAQQKRVAGLAQAQGIQESPLAFKALPDAGNDQFSLMLT